ncbi:hypothetical protein U9M48_042245 [Paspalum notatum var. saurae]|uniref:DUF4220 domain-containing protein n=1 Tax=Paspalum notatum var. saurae TaxID=547442 RepID=A0AAQ3UUX3_PASNO
MDPLKEHVEGPRADIPEQMEESERQRERILRREAYKLFVDFSSPYHQRLSILKYFWALSEAKAYASVRQGLAGAFLLLYTRLKTVFVGGSNLVRESKGSDTAVLISLLAQALRMWLPWAAIGLFHHSHREVYNDIDVKITYAMFCCTVVLDAYSTLAVSTTERNKEQWPEMVAQYSLVGYVVRKEEHRWMMRIADLFGFKVMRPCFSSHRITQLVLQYLKDGWENQIQDAATYRSFNDNRGHWTLKVEGYERQLGWSIERPFDESVLLWHIATDFCFFLSPFPDHRCAFAEKYQLLAWFFDVPKPRDTTRAQGTSSTCCQESTACRAVQCRQMSNYMMYLLFVNPEMLLPGTRRNLFTTAYHELKEIRKTSLFITTYKEIKENRPSLSATSGEEIKDTIKGRNRNLVKCKQLRPRKGERLMGRAISTTMLNKSKNASEDESGKSSKEESMEDPKEELTGGSEKKFIDDAWTLAQGLLDLGSRLSEQEMWKVIEGVWVEMLCFSASRCRGYLHAKALGSGGEFLSYIWLLQFYMGIETFTERLQREELIPSPARERLVVLPSWEGNNKVAAPSTSNTNAASSTSNNTTAFPSTSEIQVAGEGMV